MSNQVEITAPVDPTVRTFVVRNRDGGERFRARVVIGGPVRSEGAHLYPAYRVDVNGVTVLHGTDWGVPTSGGYGVDSISACLDLLFWVGVTLEEAEANGDAWVFELAVDGEELGAWVRERRDLRDEVARPGVSWRDGVDDFKIARGMVPDQLPVRRVDAGSAADIDAGEVRWMSLDGVFLVVRDGGHGWEITASDYVGELVGTRVSSPEDAFERASRGRLVREVSDFVGA